MAKLLDDSRTVSRLDTGGMLGAVDRFPEDLLNLDRYRSVVRPGNGRSSVSLALMGMGGSASAADVLLDWLRDLIQIPALVLREPTSPRHLGRASTFVAVSYSGETVETLRAFREARRRKCSLAGVGSGGTLRRICEESDVPFFQVGGGLAPRAAFGQLFTAGAVALESLGVVKNVSGKVRTAGRELSALRTRFGFDTRVSENVAKRFALQLLGRFPVVYSLQRMSSVARRFKNQLAENSKTPAKFDLLPEAGHNDIEAFTSRSRSLLPVLVRDWVENDEERVMVEAFMSVVAEAGGVRPLEVRIRTVSSLGRLLAPIMFFDYVSVYLAFLKNLDPSPTPWIHKYRRKCAASAKKG